jgi:hypothetical protein
MKKLFYLILLITCLAQAEITQNIPEAMPKIFEMIVEHLKIQDAQKELNLLRKHAQTVSNLLWLEKSEKNIAISREIIRRYFLALEKIFVNQEAKEKSKQSLSDKFQQLQALSIEMKKQQEDQSGTTTYMAS